MKVSVKTRVQTFAIALSIITVFADSAVARDRVDRRQTRQAIRVREGRLDGDLSLREQHRLNQSRRIVRRAERRAEADGVVTKKEAAVVEGLQDARSRQIHRLKNN